MHERTWLLQYTVDDSRNVNFYYYHLILSPRSIISYFQEAFSGNLMCFHFLLNSRIEIGLPVQLYMHTTSYNWLGSYSTWYVYFIEYMYNKITIVKLHNIDLNIRRTKWHLEFYVNSCKIWKPKISFWTIGTWTSYNRLIERTCYKEILSSSIQISNKIWHAFGGWK